MTKEEKNFVCQNCIFNDFIKQQCVVDNERISDKLDNGACLKGYWNVIPPEKMDCGCKR